VSKSRAGKGLKRELQDFLRLLKLAYRYSFSGSQGLPLTTLLSVGGMAIGVACLVAAMAVFSGFESTLQKTVIDVSGHLWVIKRGADSQEEALKDVKPLLKGFVAASPFIFLEAVMAKKGVVSGVGVEGIDPAEVHKVLKLKNRVVKGDLELGTGEGGLARVAIGKGLATKFDLDVNDVVRLVIPVVSSRDFSNFKPKMRKFRVGGIVSFGHHEFDSRYVLMELEEAQSFASVGERVSGHKIRLDNDEAALAAELSILEKFGSEYYVRDWKDGNRNLFEAIELEKMVVFLVLLIIVIVACFNIAGALFISVVRRYRDISILKAMGATNTMILKLFTVQGLTLGFVGSLLGFALGFLICLGLVQYQQHFGLISSEVYQLDNIELNYRWLDLAMIFFASLSICLLAAIAPAIRGSRLNPIEGLRYE